MMIVDRVICVFCGERYNHGMAHVCREKTLAMADFDAGMAKSKRQELPADTSSMLFVYVRETAAGRLVRVLHNDDANEFEDDEDWRHVATIQPRAFVEQILQDNKAIFDSVFKK